MTEMKMSKVLSSLCSERWCIDDYFGLFFSWSNNAHPATSQWGHNCIFTTDFGKVIFELLEYDIVPSLNSIQSLIQDQGKQNVSHLDITFVPHHDTAIMHWCKSVGQLCQSLTQGSSCLQLVTIWVHDRGLPQGILATCTAIIEYYVTHPWYLHSVLLHAPRFGDPIDTYRYSFYISSSSIPTTFTPPLAYYGYDNCI